MSEEWKTIPFEKSIEKVKYTSKIASSEYLEEGTYPIVSQEEGLISGYWNNSDDVFRLSKPVVIFGDHTRALKYVDFDFVLGADGVRILQPIEQIDTKFLLYYLQSCKIPSLGYSRHYKLLKELNVPVPFLAEQESIVAELDCISSIIEKQKQQLRELDNLAQAIFYDMFGDPITNEKGWSTDTLKEVCLNLFAGGDVPKGNWSKEITEEYNIPILSNGVGENALYGYTNMPRVKDVSLTISGRGTIGYCEVRQMPFFPVVRLIVATPKIDLILPITLKYIIDAYQLKGTGGAIPQLTIPMIKDKYIILPPLSLQQEFASKIEAIEKQKELIKQSLSETKTLFKSRMDYYFN